MKRLLDESRQCASGDATATGLHTETCAHSAHSGLAPIFQPCSPPRLTAPYDALSSDLRPAASVSGRKRIYSAGYRAQMAHGSRSASIFRLPPS